MYPIQYKKVERKFWHYEPRGILGHTRKKIAIKKNSQIDWTTENIYIQRKVLWAIAVVEEKEIQLLKY